MSRPRIQTSKDSLKHFIKQLRIALSQGQDLADTRVQVLVKNIRHLIHKLGTVVRRREMRRILGTTAVIVGLGATNNAQGQSFGNSQAKPFGLTTGSSVSIPCFGDLDGDGDQDMLAAEIDLYVPYSQGQMFFYENTGSVLMPQFAQALTNPFNLAIDTLESDILFPVLVDIDGDGDLDIITGGTGFYGLAMIENIGTAQSPNFDIPVTGPFGLNDTTYAASPVAIDFDDDGDLDILAGSYYGNFSYYENTGSITAPSFNTPLVNPFGLQPSYNFAFVASGDVDWDGDMDLMVGEYYGDILYYENTGSKTAPTFAMPLRNPSSIQNNSGYVSLPQLVDLDGDSDVDLFVSEYFGYYGDSTNFMFYENLATGLSLDEIENKLRVFPNVTEDFVRIESEIALQEIYLTDQSGKLIRSFKATERKLDFGDLAKGVYFLHLEKNGSHALVERIIKN